MRILYITSSFPYGRSETFLIEELQELARRGHDVWILPVRGRGERGRSVEAPGYTSLGPASLVTGELIVRGMVQLLSDPWRCFPALAAGVSITKRRASVANMLVWSKALHAARLLRELGIEHVHAFWASTPATVAMIAGELTGTPWSFTGHRWDLAAPNLLLRKVERAAGVRVVSRVGAAMLERAVCQDTKSSQRREAALAKVRVIHLGVTSAEPCVPIVARGVFLCPAALVPVKGHHVLLQAFARVCAARPTTRLILAGEGQLRGEIESAIHRLGLSKAVDMVGHLPHSVLLKLYATSQVSCVVLPSLNLGQGQHEAIPVALMEAMAHGIPVIATDTGGIAELVAAKCGLLVPAGDSSALAGAMESLLDSTDLGVALGKAGREQVLQFYNIRETVDAMLAMMAAGDRAVPPDPRATRRGAVL